MVVGHDFPLASASKTTTTQHMQSRGIETTGNFPLRPCTSPAELSRVAALSPVAVDEERTERIVSVDGEAGVLWEGAAAARVAIRELVRHPGKPARDWGWLAAQPRRARSGAELADSWLGETYRHADASLRAQPFPAVLSQGGERARATFSLTQERPYGRIYAGKERPGDCGRLGRHSMKLETGVLFAAAYLMIAAQSLAADFPKSGESEYDTYYVFENLMTIDAGPAASGIDDFTGITRNVKGEGPFHDMSVHCLTHWTVIDEKFDLDGSCVETDRDGDSVFTTFDDQAHYLVGGTGKYKGITGKAPYTVDELHKAVSDRSARVVNHKVSWEVK